MCPLFPQAAFDARGGRRMLRQRRAAAAVLWLRWLGGRLMALFIVGFSFALSSCYLQELLAAV